MVYNTLMFLGELLNLCYKIFKFFIKKENKEKERKIEKTIFSHYIY